MNEITLMSAEDRNVAVSNNCVNCRKYIEMGEDKCGECGYEPSMLLRVVIRAMAEQKNAIKLIESQKIDSNPKTITEDKIIQDTEMMNEDDAECYGCGGMPCVKQEDPMDTRFCESCFKENEKINEELDKHNFPNGVPTDLPDVNVLFPPKPKKVRKPKVECCGCNEMFRETDIFDDAYGDHYCDECYDYEYVRCFACDEEIQRDKADEEYWERDGDCYCETCRDEYDRGEKENECDDPDKPNTYFCYDACGRILDRQMTDWRPKKVKADGMYAMALVCKSCDKKNPKNWR